MEKITENKYNFVTFSIQTRKQFFWKPRSKFQVSKHRVDVVRKHINVEKVKKRGKLKTLDFLITHFPLVECSIVSENHVDTELYQCHWSTSVYTRGLQSPRHHGRRTIKTDSNRWNHPQSIFLPTCFLTRHHWKFDRSFHHLCQQAHAYFGEHSDRESGYIRHSGWLFLYVGSPW